jgi:hypothetical protein
MFAFRIAMQSRYRGELFLLETVGSVCIAPHLLPLSIT